MKKLFAIIGGVVAAITVITAILVILKKIKLSFSVELTDGDDVFGCDCEAPAGDDISISIDDESDANKDEFDLDEELKKSDEDE